MDLKKLPIAFGIVGTISGWSFAAYDRLYRVPYIEKVSRTDGLIDSFKNSSASSYADEVAVIIKKWYKNIKPLQENILNSTGSDKITLINKRDNLLISLIHHNNLDAKVNAIIGWYDDLYDCVELNRCDLSYISSVSFREDIIFTYNIFYPYINEIRSIQEESKIILEATSKNYQKSSKTADIFLLRDLGCGLITSS